MSDANDMRAQVLRRNWDFALTLITVALLGALGVQSFFGTLYSWWAQRANPSWEQTSYLSFVDTMNAIAAPMVVLLVVVMGLCVPKRLFSRTALVVVSAGMLVAGVVAWAVTGDLGDGLAVYLALAALIQVAVVALTVAGARAPSYVTEGRLTKTGSGLLHLGIVGFAFVVVALQRSPFLMPVFWAVAVCTIAGTVLSFYAGSFSVKRRVVVEDAEGERIDMDRRAGDGSFDSHTEAEDQPAQDGPMAPSED
jgi:hypothetical protein